jgi:curved DNA-binding protein
MAKDYYNILGVSKTASQDDIKKAYRKLAHQYHPDKKGGDEAKFKEASEAYSVLGDEKKRAQYDRFGSADTNSGFSGFNQGGPFGGYQQGNFEFDLGDIFAEFFGNGSGGFARAFRKGRDVSVDLHITFKESVFGVSKSIKYSRPVHEKGKVNMKNEEVVIKVPPGIDDGEMMRVTGRGEIIEEGNPGDLFVRLHVTKDIRFKKEGPHLIAELKVKITDALLGATYEVPTLEENLDVKVPRGVVHGQLLRVREKGVPISQNKRGDLLIKILIDMPPKVSRKAEKLIEELRQEGI